MRRFRGWLSPGTVLAFVALRRGAWRNRVRGHGTGAFPRWQRRRKEEKEEPYADELEREEDRGCRDPEAGSEALRSQCQVRNDRDQRKHRQDRLNLLSANVQADGSMLGRSPPGDFQQDGPGYLQRELRTGPSPASARSQPRQRTTRDRRSPSSESGSADANTLLVFTKSPHQHRDRRALLRAG